MHPASIFSYRDMTALKARTVILGYDVAIFVCKKYLLPLAQWLKHQSWSLRHRHRCYSTVWHHGSGASHLYWYLLRIALLGLTLSFPSQWVLENMPMRGVHVVIQLFLLHISLGGGAEIYTGQCITKCRGSDQGCHKHVRVQVLIGRMA